MTQATRARGEKPQEDQFGDRYCLEVLRDLSDRARSMVCSFRTEGTHARSTLACRTEYDGTEPGVRSALPLHLGNWTLGMCMVCLSANTRNQLVACATEATDLDISRAPPRPRI
jgi:hypothetical protein